MIIFSCYRNGFGDKIIAALDSCILINEKDMDTSTVKDISLYIVVIKFIICNLFNIYICYVYVILIIVFFQPYFVFIFFVSFI